MEQLLPPKIGTFVNLIGIAYEVVEGNCTICIAKGNLQLCSILPSCYLPDSKKSIIAYKLFKQL
jgi:hypothetical protein